MSFGKGTKLQMDQFTHPLGRGVDKNYAETTWAMLEDAIKEINNNNASGLSFEQLYRNAYQMVVYKFGDRLYAGVIDAEREHLRGVAARLEALTDDALLAGVKSEWDHFLKSLSVIRAFLHYLERVHVHNHKHLLPLHAAGLALWRDEVARGPRLAPRLLGLTLAAVARERGGELVDDALLRAVASMFADLGPDVYATDFEAPYLRATAEYYGAEGARLLAAGDCPAYLAAAEARLAEERARCGALLAPASEGPVLREVERELVGRNLDALLALPGSGLAAMVDGAWHADLRRLHALAARVPEGLSALQAALGDHVRRRGGALVADPERARDPVAWVAALVEEREACELLVSEAFGGDRQFVYAVNRAFEAFMNTAPRAPEYVSLFLDDRLRRGARGGAGEEELESALDAGVLLFRFLRDKDVFERYAKQHLARRLLAGRAAAEDAERGLLLRLKAECGYQFTSKLESMFTDMRTSRDALAAFKAHPAAAALELDLSVQVLTTGSWPAAAGGTLASTASSSSSGSGATSGAGTCVLPRELETATEAYRQYYTAAHSGRRLAWQPTMGTAEIKASFGGRRHELSCTTYQMIVLMLFNDAQRLTTREIGAATGIPVPELRRVLQSLACVKGKNVLRKEPMSRDVGDSDVFSINDAFQSKLYKVKIGMVAAAQRDSEEGREEARERVEEDRKPQIEAAIVRIMKSRRVLSHSQVVAEVTTQLSSRFLPNPHIIKQRIESLIEREFLERDEADRSLYRYVA